MRKGIIRQFRDFFWNPEYKNFNLEDPNQKIDGKTIAEIFGAKSSSSGISVTQDQAMGISAVWACNRVIASPISYMPIKVYQKTTTGREERPEHTANQLFRQFNDYTNKVNGVDRLITHRNLWGNGLFLKFYDREGNVNRLDAIHPSRIVEAERTANELIIHIRGIGDNKDKVYGIPYSELIHLPGPGDGVLGKSDRRVCERRFGFRDRSTAVRRWIF